MHDRLHKVVCPRERHFGSVVGASGTLIVLGGRDGSATPMALGNHKVFQEKCKQSFYYIFCTQYLNLFVLLISFLKEKITMLRI